MRGQKGGVGSLGAARVELGKMHVVMGRTLGRGLPFSTKGGDFLGLSPSSPFLGLRMRMFFELVLQLPLKVLLM